MQNSQHAQFQISLKALITNLDKLLVLINPDNYFDFPGGRIDESDLGLELTKSLEREVREECGQKFNFKLSGLALITKRNYTANNQNHQILAIYYRANYLDGEIDLSHEHKTCQWLMPMELFDYPDRFMSRDEYEQFKQYFAIKQ